MVTDLFLKKSGKNKGKLRTRYPNNHENFKNSKPRVRFYWFLCKKRVLVKERFHNNLQIQLVLLRNGFRLYLSGSSYMFTCSFYNFKYLTFRFSYFCYCETSHNLIQQLITTVENSPEFKISCFACVCMEIWDI